MKKTVLVTGASGLLGHYLIPMLKDWQLVSLGRNEQSDIKCDLETEMPAFTGFFSSGFDLVIHCAGTNDDSKALSLNLRGTQNLLKGLVDMPIKKMVYISSTDVYGNNESEEIAEDGKLSPLGKTGQSKILAEKEFRDFCDERNITLTILRPTTLFGQNMKGWGAQMAADVLSGYYLNIRDAEAKTSLLLAYDLARVILLTESVGGIYNVTDMRPHTMQSLALAMGDNHGKKKKSFFLPLKWANILASIGDKVYPVGRFMNSEKLLKRTSSLVFSAKKLHETFPDFIPYDTEAVISRIEKNYPYEDD